jgi:hypothetical protein
MVTRRARGFVLRVDDRCVIPKDDAGSYGRRAESAFRPTTGGAADAIVPSHEDMDGHTHVDAVDRVAASAAT